MTKVDTVNDFVSRLFKSILDRDLETAELDSYISGLENGSLKGSDLVKELINSEEAVTDTLDDSEFTEFLFTGILGRNESDGYKTTTEYNDYANRLLNGTEREDLLNDFLNSDLFNNYCVLIGIQA